MGEEGERDGVRVGPGGGVRGREGSEREGGGGGRGREGGEESGREGGRKEGERVKERER